MTEAERAIEFVRIEIKEFRIHRDSPEAKLLAEHDRLKAEIERLTTLRPIEVWKGEPALLWVHAHNGKDWALTTSLAYAVAWTHRPAPLTKDDKS